MPIIPFYRRILPWLYLAIFIIVAPLLILYTAGYRYNAKKALLERNGTLIVDSIPKGASVLLDHRSTNEKTPITFQNISPGWHTMRLNKDGYHGWEKILEIRPQHVAFANQIRLWRDTQPKKILSGSFRGSTADPPQEKLGLILDTATSTVLNLWTPELGLIYQSVLEETTGTPAILRWHEDGRSLLISGFSSEETIWWMTLQYLQPKLEKLPAGTYRWSDHDLVSRSGRSLMRLDTNDGSLTRETLKPDVVDKETGFTLQTTSSAAGLLLVNHAFWQRLYALPPGDWRFEMIQKPYILLRTHDRWLSIHPQKNEHPWASQVTGDVPRWLPRSKHPTALVMNRHEVWFWPIGQAPTLLWRQSEPLVQTVWHPSGSSIFVATEQEIFALEIQDKNGRLVTPLARFSRIYDMTLLGKSLYIAAEKNGERGLWELGIE